MPARLYSVAEIQKLIKPIAERYGVERVLLFGSYARGNAQPGSDIDVRIDSGAICGFFKLACFHRELEEALDAHIDVLTTGALDEKFLSHIEREKVLLYEN